MLMPQNHKNMLEKILAKQVPQYLHLGLDCDRLGNVVHDVKVDNE